MFTLGVPVLEIVVRTIAIYAALLVVFRLFGKREVGQFTLYDLVFVLLVANAVQPAITGPDTSLVGGVVIVGVLAAVNYAVGRLEQVRLFSRVLEGEPTVIIKDGHYVDSAMRREGIDPQLCETAIREHGYESVDDVKLGVLEPDGTVSIVPNDSPITRTRRRVRYRRS